MQALTIDNLFARRSIRRYTEEEVTLEEIEVLLKAAMAAPSAGNRKPWHFVVIDEREVLEALADAHPYARMLHEAPMCIVPCGEPDLGASGKKGYWIQDLSAATENILLAAVGLGLGAVWCGVFPVEERVEVTRNILGLPGHVVPLAYVAIGHPAEQKPPRTQYDATRVHVNSW
ncbi:MAG: nitroreductase family protein [Anaerolineales bacterium]